VSEDGTHREKLISQAIITTFTGEAITVSDTYCVVHKLIELIIQVPEILEAKSTN
jgi:hypothetical protein